MEKKNIVILGLCVLVLALSILLLKPYDVPNCEPEQIIQYVESPGYNSTHFSDGYPRHDHLGIRIITGPDPTHPQGAQLNHTHTEGGRIE